MQLISETDKSVFTNMNKIKCTSLLILVVITIITCINPIYPHEQYLQHAGTVLLMIPLLFDVVNNRMTNLTFVCIVLFALLHVVGARYIYSYVPYKEWSISAGIVNADFFQDTRNHYDRFVHFSFGLLMFPFFTHLCKEWLKLNVPKAILVSWLIVQTGSMIYELFEWLLTVVMTSEEADYYNGQQGDMWDAQKDMVLAMVGSTISAVCYMVRHKFSHK